MKTQNGRPMQRGAMYFEQTPGGGTLRKYCVSYCPDCKKKIGLTHQELEELDDLLPRKAKSILIRLLHARLVIPR